MGRPKERPLPEAHRANIGKALRTSEAARKYHKERQTGKKRPPFSLEWRAKMSVSRRLSGMDKNHPIYLKELEATMARLGAQDVQRSLTTSKEKE